MLLFKSQYKVVQWLLPKTLVLGGFRDRHVGQDGHDFAWKISHVKLKMLNNLSYKLKKAAESLCLNVVVVFTYFFLNNLRFCWNNNKMCFYNRAILVCVTHIIHSQKNGITSLYSTFSGLTGTV